MRPQTVLEILEAARKLIANEDDWLCAPKNNFLGEQRVNGRLKRCSGAALAQAGAPWPSRRDVWGALRDFMKPVIHKFNDTHTHAEVLAAFDAAIAAEKSKAEAH